MSEASSNESYQDEQIVVLIDGSGNYYELTRETLEKSKVPDEKKAEIDAKIQNVLVATGYIGSGGLPGGIVRTFSICLNGLRYVGYYLGRLPDEHN